jgi:hypothetical protein
LRSNSVVAVALLSDKPTVSASDPQQRADAGWISLIAGQLRFDLREKRLDYNAMNNYIH